MLNNSIGAPVPKSISSDMNKTPTPNGTNHTRLALGYCHPCGHIVCRDCAMKNAHNTCKICRNSKQKKTRRFSFV